MPVLFADILSIHAFFAWNIEFEVESVLSGFDVRVRFAAVSLDCDVLDRLLSCVILCVELTVSPSSTCFARRINTFSTGSVLI